MLRAGPRKFLYALGLVAASVVASALIRDTVYNGHDFTVFWRAGRVLIDGEPLYSVARDGAAAFKYPPWIAPVFIPFALLPLETAKWAWGLVQVFSLAAIAWLLLRDGIKPVRVIATAALFWGIWATHALDGQTELPLLAAILALEKRAPVVLWALSAKAFTLVSAFLIPRARWAKGAAVAAGAFVVLSIPAWRAEGYGNPFALARSWVETASSGGTQFPGGKIRGRDNQGLPALVLRAASVPARKARADLVAACLIAALGAFTWARVSRRLPRGDRTAGWLALGAVAHPLAWFHLFVFAFPLAVRAIDRAISSRRRPLIALAVIGAVFVAAVTRKTLGPVGAGLELASVKSWGVIACLAALRLSARGAARSS